MDNFEFRKKWKIGLTILIVFLSEKLARKGSETKGGIFKTDDTKIYLYAEKNDPAKKVKFMMWEKMIMAEMKKK